MHQYRLNWRRTSIRLILNEREYAEQIIFSNEFITNPAFDIGVVAKYYYAEGYKQKDVKRKLGELLLRCDPTANLVLWDGQLDRQSKRAVKRSMVEIDFISITQREVDAIRALPNRTIKKMAFSYLCTAKYFNKVNDKNNDWTNLPIKDICSMGNVAIPVDKQYAMRGELARLGYLQLSMVVDNVNARVLFADNDGEEVMRITEMRDLGNQYFQHCGEPYIYCDMCGKLVRKRSNRAKHCTVCAKKIDYQKRTERYQNA